MQQNIKTLFRLSILPVVAIAPFALMHKSTISCSQPTEIKVCIVTSHNPSVLIQAAISLAAVGLVYLSYKIWQNQLRNLGLSQQRKFVLQNIALTAAVGLGAGRAYTDIKYHHSQDGGNIISAVASGKYTSNFHPFFGYGIRPIIFWTLLAIYVLVPVVSLYKLFIVRNPLKKLKKR